MSVLLLEREPVSMPVSATVLPERESIAPVVVYFAVGNPCWYCRSRVGNSERTLVEDIDTAVDPVENFLLALVNVCLTAS